MRISHLKHVFEREFMEKFTGEVFKIKDRFMKQNIPMYKLQDLNDEKQSSARAPDITLVSSAERDLQQVKSELRRVRKKRRVVKKRKHSDNFDKVK